MKTENISFNHQDNIQIRFNDMDGLGHANNSTIQEYFDLGRLGYFNEVFKNEVNWKEFGAIVATITTDFLAPVFLNDKLVVKTKILFIGDKSMKMIQHIVDDKQILKATCSSVMVGFDPKTQTSVVIPDQWRRWISEVEQTNL